MLGLTCLLALLFKLSQKPALFLRSCAARKVTDSAEGETGMSDLAQLFNSETEDDDFDGFD